MNRKFLLLLAMFFVLATLSPVWATPKIEFNSPKTASLYNAGDQVVADGTITLDKTILGATVTFKAYSKRYNLTVQLAKRFYNFEQNIPATFSQINLGNVIWEIPSNVQVGNDWKIVIDVNKVPQYSTSFESGFFAVSKTLPLTANVNSYVLNYGETLEATGTALTVKNAPVKGTGNILLEHSEIGTVKSETVEVKDGFIKLQYPFNNNDPQGEYRLTFKVTDTNGNTGFIVLNGITLSNELKLSCSIPASEYLPGDTFAVTGKLTNIHNSPLKAMQLVAYLTQPSEKSSLSFTGTTDAAGSYEIPITTPKLARPGQYALRVAAEDSDGNSGSCNTTLFLNVERNLDVDFTINSSWYYNESELGNELIINNKGNVDLVGKLSLLLDDTEVMSQDIAVGSGLEKTFKPFWIVMASPGLHTIRAAIKAQGETLYTSEPQEITVFPKPPPKEILSPAAWQLFIVIGIIVIAILVYVKQKELRDYFWHLELKRKYGIGK